MTKDSRLERFLKALCSLDYSDLPTPLSRVEVLWSCLVTGEATPDFQPQSRTEKYLMTILGVYDLEDIPKPISRGEVLLYKLAMGDTDVDLEDGAKSRYERLLSEIVANGGVGDNVDFEYVTYVLSESFNTLYNTVNEPVKSAILKGRTLVNLVGEKRLYNNYNAKPPLYGCEFMLPYNLTKGKTYLAVFNATGTISSGNSKVYLMDNGFDSGSGNGDYPVDFKVGYNMVKCVASGDNHRVLRIRTQVETLRDLEVSDVMLIEYQEGMENWDIPYFEGMQSVKMPVLTTTGKNLFDVNGEKELSCFYSATLNGHRAEHNDVDTYTIKIKPNTEYFLTCEGLPSMSHITYWDENLSYIGAEPTYGDDVIRQTTSPQGAKYMRLPIHKEGVLNIQIEEGSVATSYEPFKSSILTTNEEVTLHGIGDVKDELNLLTGEVTERIGEIVLDGSEYWEYTNKTFRSKIISDKVFEQLTSSDRGKIYLICDKHKSIAYSSPWDSGKFIALHISKEIVFSDERFANVNDWKQYLSQNPITVQYHLATESIKTVDLSILNQDDKPTKLKTFDDITYVDISSNGLLPELETTVLTKNLEQLSTMGLRMNDILDDQERIKDDNNALNNDLESTMLATTEIYEDIL